MKVSLSGPAGNLATDQHGAGPTQLGRGRVVRALVGRSGTRCGIARSRTIGSELGGPSPNRTERRPETLRISTEPDLQRLGRSRAD